MGMTRFNASVLLLLSLLLILSGCVDRNQLKADVLNAVRKHESVRNYRFSGSLEQVRQPAAEERHALAGLWPGLSAEAAVTWQGVASFDPLRAEADIRIAVPGRDPVHVPLFIQHNKMVFHLPGVQPEGQYFAVDLAALAGRSGRDAAAPLAGSGHRFAGAVAAFIDGIDTRMFDEPEEWPAGRRINATFNEKQAEAFGRFWRTAWPAFAAALAEGGPAGAAVAGGTADLPAAFTLLEPVRFAFDLNEDGYLEQLRADAFVSWQEADGSTASRRIKLIHRHDDINADPPFRHEIPENAVPLEKLLELVAGGGSPGQPDTADGTASP